MLGYVWKNFYNKPVTKNSTWTGRKDVEFKLHILIYMTWIPNIFAFYDLKVRSFLNFLLLSPVSHSYKKIALMKFWEKYFIPTHNIKIYFFYDQHHHFHPDHHKRSGACNQISSYFYDQVFYITFSTAILFKHYVKSCCQQYMPRKFMLCIR